MPKLIISLEVEIADIPPEYHDDLNEDAAGLWDEDEDGIDAINFNTATFTDRDCREALDTYFEGYVGSEDYELQMEAWAGSNLYCWIKRCKVIDMTRLKEES